MIAQWGNHAPYIVMAYLAATAVFIFLFVEPWWRRRRLQRRLRTQWRREQMLHTQTQSSSSETPS